MTGADYAVSKWTSADAGSSVAATVVDELAFKARALAQAHPLSKAALAYRARLLNSERRDQPVPEIADWAASAFLVGYCVRRIEETERGMPVPIDDRELATIRQSEVKRFTSGLFADQSAALIDHAALVELLDRVIATEIGKRQEHVREQLDPAQWAEFEAYVSWWVVRGWATRAVERHLVDPLALCES